MKRPLRGNCPLLFFLLLFLITPLLVGCFPWPESPPIVKEVALGDLDGDGALDAVLANGRFGEPYSYPTEIRYQILYNDGNGTFSHEGNLPNQWNYTFVALGEFNGDGAVDAVIGGPPVVFFNDGSGGFSGFADLQGSPMLSGWQSGVDVSDLDGDGSLDIFVANCCGVISFTNSGPTTGTLIPSHNLVFLNDGSGGFRSNGQQLGTAGSTGVALGDLNGDGALDAFVANGQTQTGTAGSGLVLQVPNEVWFNDGNGTFTDSGQLLGQAESHAVALGDVDGDGFLDAVVGNKEDNKLWLNDGTGNFRDSGRALGDGAIKEVFLEDLDGDGDLDLITAGKTEAVIWLNDGSGRFRESGSIRYEESEAVAVGDVDGDGTLDIFVAGVNVYAVWLNDGSGQFEKR